MMEEKTGFKITHLHILFGMLLQIGFMFFYFGQQSKDVQINTARITKLEVQLESQARFAERVGVLESQQVYLNNSIAQLHVKMDKLTDSLMKGARDGR